MHLCALYVVVVVQCVVFFVSCCSTPAYFMRLLFCSYVLFLFLYGMIWQMTKNLWVLVLLFLFPGQTLYAHPAYLIALKTGCLTKNAVAFSRTPTPLPVLLHDPFSGSYVTWFATLKAMRNIFFVTDVKNLRTSLAYRLDSHTTHSNKHRRAKRIRPNQTPADASKGRTLQAYSHCRRSCIRQWSWTTFGIRSL